MNIVVVGAGYVGLSNAVLLAQHNHVVACDIMEKKVKLINDRSLKIILQIQSLILLQQLMQQVHTMMRIIL